jgi:hypothetical protein
VAAIVAPQTGASIARDEVRGIRVRVRLNLSGVIGTLALTAALGGCANVDFDTSQNWFSKPLDIAGRNAGGYTFSELAETKQHQRPVTPNDLVDANGGCPARAQPQTPANAPGTPNPAPAPDAASLLGGGIALGMNECDVVLRAGQPSGVQIGQNPNGERTALLTFNVGPRPGVYRFERGMLTEMDRAAQASNPPPPPEKKKASKSTKPQKSSNPT